MPQKVNAVSLLALLTYSALSVLLGGSGYTLLRSQLSFFALLLSVLLCLGSLCSILAVVLVLLWWRAESRKGSASASRRTKPTSTQP